MRRTLLVAQRELAENLRTKGFWIGLLLFPVLLTAMTVLPGLLEKTKSARQYAVIDESGWLLAAVDERAERDDATRLLRFVQRKAQAGGSAFEDLPDALRAVGAQVRDLSPAQLDALARTVTAAGRSVWTSQEGESAPGKALPDAARQAGRDAVSFVLSLSAEDTKELKAGLSGALYVRAEIPLEGQTEKALRARLDAKKDGLFAYFVVGSDPLSTEPGQHKYVSNNRTDTDLKDWFSRLASEEVEARRFREEGVDPAVAARIQRPFVFDEKRVDETGAETEVSKTDLVRQWAPVAFVYLLWVAIFTIANMLMTNTIEEKSSRIIEVLLSSVSPLELMAGKVVGIAGTGLLLIGSWVGFLIAAIVVIPRLFGVQLGLDLGVLVGDPVFLLSFVVYFVLGYLFYAAVLVAIGSVCNSLKDAQNLMGPVMLVMFVPLMAMVPVAKDPNGALAKVLSFLPPFTPFVMMNRAAGPPQAWEYVLSTALLVVAIGVAFWMAAKIFRIGVLMTGKPPRLGEILRWLRTPVGSVPTRPE